MGRGKAALAATNDCSCQALRMKTRVQLWSYAFVKVAWPRSGFAHAMFHRCLSLGETRTNKVYSKQECFEMIVRNKVYSTPDCYETEANYFHKSSCNRM